MSVVIGKGEVSVEFNGVKVKLGELRELLDGFGLERVEEELGRCIDFSGAVYRFKKLRS